MTKNLKYLLAILVIILLLGGVFFLGMWWTDRLNKDASTEHLVIPTKKKSTEETKTTETKKTTPSTETTKTEDGWKLFTNNDFGYSISYPKDAKLSFTEDSEAEDAGFKNGKVCVNINTAKGYVIISAKENKDFKIICGRTGVGQDYENVKDTIEVGDKTYDANGMKLQYASAGNHDEFYFFSLDDGTKIEYGVNLNDRYDEIKFEDAMAEVKKIIKSYKAI